MTTVPDDDPTADPAPESAPHRRRRHRRRRILLAVGALIVLWLVAVAATALAAYSHDKSGLDQLQQLRSNLNPDQVSAPGTQRSLDAAHAQFAAAHRELSQPWMVPLEVVPVVGRQYAAVRDLSSAAATVASTGSSFVSGAHAVLQSPHGAGPERVAALRQLASLSGAAAARLDAIDVGPSAGLVSVLASKHNEFVSQLTDAESRLAHAAAVSSATAAILKGPRTYLVLASNNAEMRAGSGAFLEVGTATTSDGTIHLGPMQPAGSLTLPAGAVPVPAELARNWGWLQPGRDWRNLGVTPQFDVTASMAAAMWKADTGQTVDGVLSLDVVGLKQLLQATGPVTAAGVTVDASSVEQYLLHDQYAGLSDSATGDTGRRDRLGALASAVLHQLEGQSTDLTTLAKAMASATEGRHLLMWSADPTAEAAWTGAGVAGAITAKTVAVTVLNRGGNKLDPYLSTSVTVTTRPAGADTAVTLHVHLANSTPPGQSQYIAGPYPGVDAVAGEYVGLVAVNVPGRARLPTLVSGGPLVTVGAEGPTWVVVSQVHVLAGSSDDTVVTFTVPGRHGSMTVMPSARVPTEQWTMGTRHFDDAAPETVSW